MRVERFNKPEDPAAVTLNLVEVDFGVLDKVACRWRVPRARAVKIEHGQIRGRGGETGLAVDDRL